MYHVKETNKWIENDLDTAIFSDYLLRLTIERDVSCLRHAFH
jgi:hypothetical protein